VAGLFYVTIVIAVIYMLYYHVLGVGYLQQDEWAREKNPSYVRVQMGPPTILGLLPEYRSPLYQPGPDMTPRRRAFGDAGPAAVVVMSPETDTVTYLPIADPARLASGREIYLKNCASCHGQLGEGGVGPNLTDDYWLHGDGMTNVVKSVKYGYPAQGMIAWRMMLKPDDILDVSGYVLTLRGANPPTPKPRRAELIVH
jgi:cytochrome c oxidase cbb3-type subunit 3